MNAVSAASFRVNDVDAPASGINSSQLGSAILVSQSNYKSDYRAAVNAFKANSFPEAISLFARVLSTPGANIEFINKALIGRSQAFLVIGQPALAISDLKKVRYPADETENIGSKELILGVAYIQIKQYNLALNHLSFAIKLLPDDESAYSNRAVAYQSLGNYNAAAKDIERALQINPTPATVFNLAVLEKDRKNYKRCYYLLSQIEKQQAAYADVYLQRGLCAKRINQYEKALSDFLKAASIDNQKAEALENIGLVMLRLGDKKNGLKYLESASTLYLSQGNINKFEQVSNAILSANSN